MELKTRSKRPGDNREIDVFYEETEGFSEHINDKSVYKMVFVREGSTATSRCTDPEPVRNM